MMPVFKPSFGDEELEAVKEVMKSGWVGLGPKVKEFEEAFASYIGCKYAVAVNSGTSALHLALKILGIENMEVITTPMTFVSTNHVILYCGAVPVFADIEPDTLNIDVGEIEELIEPSVGAIMVVHYGGHACDMDPIMKIAEKAGIPVIEDAAHAAGGEYKGRKLGSIGDLGCFSFHAVKNMSTGEGGMITTNDEIFYEKLMKLRWMGINKGTWERADRDEHYSWYYNVEEVGFKYHMSDIPAAIGLVQLKRLDAMNEKRRKITQAYNETFKTLSWIETPLIRSYAKSSHHNYVIKLEHRNDLCTWLSQRGISTGVHYIPNNHYKMYRDCVMDTPVCEEQWKRLLTLPLYPDMTLGEVDLVIKAVEEFGWSSQKKLYN